MELTRSDTDERALSPVVGTALLLAITVLLVSVSAVLIFGATEEKPAAPTANLELESVEGSDDYMLEMTAGDTIDGDRITLRGVEDADALAGGSLVAGTRLRVTPTNDTIRVIWTEDAGDPVTYTLQTFDVEQNDSASGGDDGFEDGSVFTGRGGDIISIEGDGGSTSTLVSSGTVEGIGSPDADVTGDGSEDLPFVTDDGSSQEIKLVDVDGNVTKAADSSDVNGDIRTSKTALAVGSWDGSPTSVFFTNASSPKTIYRSTPSGSATEVATPGDGAQAIAGTADIDDDGDEELVFADGSQTIQYIEPSGTVVDTTQSLGSSTGIGSGSVGTLDGYSGDVASGVNGGNYVYVVNGSSNDEISGSRVSGGDPRAKQSPTSIADVDDDGDNELVYVGNANGKIKYLDNFGGTLTKTFLRDDSGNKIDGSSDTGVG